MAARGDTHVDPKRLIALTSEEIADRIIMFGEKLAGIGLYPYQYEFAVSIIKTVLDKDGKTITALFSRQSGKTETVAVVAVACAILLPAFARMFPHDKRVMQYKRGFWVGVYAPKEEQAKLAFDRVRKYSTSKTAREAYADQDLQVELESARSDTVQWSSGSKVKARTASDNSMSEGDTWDLLIGDESQAISKEKINKELRPMLQDTGGPMVLIGTTGGSLGYFHARINRNLEEEREHGDRRHFQADYIQVIKQKRQRYDEEVERWNRFARASAKRQSEMLAEDHNADAAPREAHLNYERQTNILIADFGGQDKAELDETFQLNFMLKWGANSMIAIPPVAWDRLAVPSLELNDSGVTGFLVAGLDFAKGANEGSDETVLSILHIDTRKPVIESTAPGREPIIHYMKTLIALGTFRGDFENFQNDAVVRMVRTYPGIRRMVCDSNGMGDPITSRLRKLLPEVEVEGLSWASTANKSLCYKLFLQAVRGQHLRYAAGPNTRTLMPYKKMREQVLGLEKKFIGNSSIMVCEAPEGDHDDFPDSLAYACYAAEQAMEIDAPGSMEEIECTDHFLPTRHQQQYSGPPTRADSYRGGRRGASRYGVPGAF